MSGSLSQDELDALLADMGGGEDAGATSTDAGLNSGGGSIPPGQQPFADVIAESFQSGAAGVGVMLATGSSLTTTGQSWLDQSAVEDQYGGNHVIFHMGLNGKASGKVALAIPSDSVASIVGTAMSMDASEVDFNEEQLGAVVELISPVLIGIGRSLSGKIGNQLNPDPVEAVLTDGTSFPLQSGAYLVVEGTLNIDGIMNNTVGLLADQNLLSSLEASTGTSASPGATPASPGPGAPEQAPAKKKENYNQQNLNLLMDVEMPLTVELGRTQMYIKEVLGMGEGSIIELDKLAGEPVDLMVNKKLIAKGEVVVIDENFGVRVTEIVNPRDRIKLGNY